MAELIWHNYIVSKPYGNLRWHSSTNKIVFFPVNLSMLLASSNCFRNSCEFVEVAEISRNVEFV